MWTGLELDRGFVLPRRSGREGLWQSVSLPHPLSPHTAPGEPPDLPWPEYAVVTTLPPPGDEPFSPPPPLTKE